MRISGNSDTSRPSGARSHAAGHGAATSYSLVTTRAELEAACVELAGGARYYLDTEFDSTREGARLSLVQLSRGRHVFLFDALRLTDLTPLRAVLGAPDVEWVLHSGAQDVPLLVRALGVPEPPRVFDTQVVWALTSAEHCVSLAYLKYRLLGTRSPKAHQADDWTRRPLSESQLGYAAADVAPLPSLHRALARRAEERGRLDLVHAASRELVWAEPEVSGAVSLESFRNAWQLDYRSQAALRFMIEWLNSLSPAERDEAPDTKVLLSIASRLPETAEQLARMKGVSRRFASRRGEWLVAELARVAAQADAGLFVPIEPAAYATFRDIKLDAWLGYVRAELCRVVEIAPELALPSRVLRRLRALLVERGEPRGVPDALEGWRRVLLRDPLASICADVPLGV